MARGILKVKIVGDERDLTGALKRSKEGLSGLGKAVAAFAGGAALISFAKSSVTAFEESEKADTSLMNTLQHNRALIKTSLGDWSKLATSIEHKTAVDDEAIKSGLAVLGSFKLNDKQLRASIPLVVDYARKTGQDVPSAAASIGKALLGNTRALKTIGINYKATGNSAKDFTNITSLLRSKVGGFAEAEGKTASGRLAEMRNRLDDVKETVGSALVPVLTKFADMLSSVIDFVGRNSAVIKPLAIILGTVAGAIFAVTKAVKIWKAAQEALDVVLDANPIGLVAAALVGLGLVAVKFHKQIGRVLTGVGHVFRSTFEGVARFLHGWGGLILAPITGGLSLVIGHFKAFRTAITHIVGGITHIVAGVGRVLGSMFNGAVAGIKAALNAIISIIERGINAALAAPRALSRAPIIGRAIPDVPIIHLPRLAKGGIVRKPTVALIGEAGPEAVLPLRSLGGGRIVHQPLGGPFHLHVDLRGAVITDERALNHLAEKLRRALLKKKRSNVALGLG